MTGLVLIGSAVCVLGLAVGYAIATAPVQHPALSAVSIVRPAATCNVVQPWHRYDGRRT